MSTQKKNPAAVALGRLGGKKGVKNERKALPGWRARQNINARWDAVRKQKAAKL